MHVIEAAFVMNFPLYPILCFAPGYLILLPQYKFYYDLKIDFLQLALFNIEKAKFKVAENCMPHLCLL